MNLLEALPLLNGWQYDTKTISRRSLAYNASEYEIWGVPGRGWLHSFYLIISNPHANIRFRNDEFLIDIFPYALNLAGIDQAWHGIFLTRYIPVLDIFAIGNPITPFLNPYNNYFRMTVNPANEHFLLKTPITSSTVIQGGQITVIKITDVKLFREGIERLNVPYNQIKRAIE